MRCDDYCSIDKVGLKNCKERISTVTEDDLDYLALQFHNIVRIMTIELNKKVIFAKEYQLIRLE